MVKKGCLTGSVELSLVVPAYNEEAFIEGTLCEFDSIFSGSNSSYEIVVVDDGSKDGTLKKASLYAGRNRHVKIVSYSENVGKGHAVKTGFMESSGEIVIFADSDMEIDLTTVSTYIEALNKGDIVIASKYHPDSVTSVPISRRISSYAFNCLVRLLTGIPLKDTQSGLKAMRKSAFVNIFPKLAVKRYAFDVELLAVASVFGLKVVEMPVNMSLNNRFKTKEVWRMFIDLLGISYRLRVLHWYEHEAPHRNVFQKLFNVFS